MLKSLFFIITFSISLVGCTFTPVAQYAVTDKPKIEDMIGVYKISADMVVEDKRNNLPNAKIEILAEGTCNLVNFPIYSVRDKLHLNIEFQAQYNGNCHWKPKIVASVKRDGTYLDAWGICFDASNFSPDTKCAQFANDGSPYNLVFLFGDPDQNDILVFDKNVEK